MILNRERKKKIKRIKQYDLVITSYDLLKRDIEVYKENKYKFRFAIADEAQYLKNSNTQNAKSIKEIKAETRYALTGTPIENNLLELWSIFDFIMPGYLFDRETFMVKYYRRFMDNKELSIEFKNLINPFIFILTQATKNVLYFIYE